jgi:hypothetical protein
LTVSPVAVRADGHAMRRLIFLSVVVPLVAALAVVAVTIPERRRSIFPVEPGTEQTFRGDQLVAGDRFTCHGLLVFEQRAHDGRWGSVSSNGLRIAPTRDGGVEIRCPADLSEI